MSPAVAEGTRLGPYEVLDLVGRGGMGEVYRARDPRLGREVAVKVLPAEVAHDARRLARFEREARAVAALNHPNILTVYDVGNVDGIAYLVTELLEGQTLRAWLLTGALPAQRALGWALEIVRGLEAAHARGIVHRDLKPSNVFVAAEGRVRILDFGLAQPALRGGAAAPSSSTTSDATPAGTVAGTLAYMSPEQLRGAALDGRSDLFSFGVVLYEMLAGTSPFGRESGADVVSAILHDPAPLLSERAPATKGPLERIVERCLEKRAEDRFASAHDLGLALEALIERPSGATLSQRPPEPSPYPGLASFTERDAADFFGREREVAALWEKLQKRSLLAVIGPSGAGKTSFVRAGVVASGPPGWAAAVCTPGRAPLRALAQTLVPEFAGDPDTLRRLVAVDEPEDLLDLAAGWRRRHDAALLVCDQFEELFTLNPAETQTKIATLLGRLPTEADVHVLLALRDDFLIRTQEQAAFEPLLQELTALLPMSGEGLRRAVIEPARRHGCRFEDDALVEQLVAAVEGERGALPLLAFAMARLWEERDRERRLLTRKAYEAIGGVEGALARHAESTLERIGPERQGLVREIFRNLVTAQGTRAVADREELLSAFTERDVAEEVLKHLVDARLLTSYEMEAGEDQAARHRVEIVHESLLRSWPRLVRWQAQDADGAVLRDQLKQAAHLWDDKGRVPDLLWSGTAYREFELWRERYPGTLTTVEQDYSQSMVERVRRRRRRRRVATAAAFALLTGVAAMIGISRQQAVRSAERAERESLLATAAHLVALGRHQLETYPTAALAYARKSLEVADTAEGRHLALEALWTGPIARVLPLEAEPYYWTLDFGARGTRLAVSGPVDHILVYSDDGALLQTIGDLEVTANPRPVVLHPTKPLLATNVGGREPIQVFSVDTGEEVQRLLTGPLSQPKGWLKDRPVSVTLEREPRRQLYREWGLTDGTPRDLTHLQTDGLCGARLDWEHERLVYARDREIRVRLLRTPGDDRLVGREAQTLLASSPNKPSCLGLASSGGLVAVANQELEIHVWPARANAPGPLRVLTGMGALQDQSDLAVESSGQWIAWGSADRHDVYLWDVAAPRDTRFRLLRRSDSDVLRSVRFHPQGRWLAVANGNSVTFWPVHRHYPRLLLGHTGSFVGVLSFSADSAWLASGATQGDGVRLWPLSPTGSSGYEEDRPFRGWPYALAFNPVRPRLLIGGAAGPVIVTSVPAGVSRQLMGKNWETGAAATGDVSWDAAGRRAAWGSHFSPNPEDREIRIWDLQTGDVQRLPLCEGCDSSELLERGIRELRFATDGTLFTGGQGGVFRWDLESARRETLLSAGRAIIDLSRDGRRLVAALGQDPAGCLGDARLLTIDLESGVTRALTTHGRSICHVVIDAAGEVIATASADGVVRVGRVTGEEPHLLLGHEGQVRAVALSPDGRWVASASGTEIRLWPMPDLDQPPFHTLSLEALMEKLSSLTNVIVVEDPSAPTGYRMSLGPFPGWKDVPKW